MSTVESLFVSIVSPVCFAQANFEGNECTAEQLRIGSCRTTDVQTIRVLRCLLYLHKEGANIFQPFLNANGADHRHLFFYSFRSGVQMSGVRGECSGKRGVGLFNADENGVVVCMAVLAV